MRAMESINRRRPITRTRTGCHPCRRRRLKVRIRYRFTLTCCANVISVMKANRYVALVLGVVLTAIFNPDLSFETTLPRFESGSSGLNKRNGMRFAKSMDRADSVLLAGLRGHIPEVALQVQPSYIPTPT